MRFGLQIPNFDYGTPDDQMWDGVKTRAQIAENAGFHSVWVMDHFLQLPPLGGPTSPILEGYMTLAALAAVTEKVQLGTLVTGVTYRNPAHLAKIVTTLDAISGGRAILGLGAAWYDVEHDAYDFRFPPVKERMDRLEEAAQICRLMFTEETPSFSGQYYKITEARNLPRPIQAGGPKIMIGGGGEKRTLRAVAQYADQCNIVGGPDDIRHKIDVIKKHCADAGRDFDEIEITRMSTLVRTGSDEETEQVRQFVAAAAGDLPPDAVNIGQEHELVDQVAALAEAGVDECIFNMPLADPDTISATATALAKAF